MITTATRIYIRSRNRFWDALLVLAGGGVGGCGYLIHLGLTHETLNLCKVLGSSCGEIVNDSQYHINGFSPASLGLGYFCGFLVYAALMRFSSKTNYLSEISPLLLIAMPGIGVSFYYTYLLAFELEKSCAVCIGIHIINFMILTCIFCRLFCQQRLLTKRMIRPYLSNKQCMWTALLALVMASNATLLTSLVEARQDLAREQNKIGDSLAYYQYLYDKSPVNTFGIDPGDDVVGEPGIAIHQIVCIYKEDCPYCRQAKKRLVPMVQEHDTAIYLILKNAAYLSTDLLQGLNVQKVPAVFINGKFAAGWQVDGFFDQFVNDCGC